MRKTNWKVLDCLLFAVLLAASCSRHAMPIVPCNAVPQDSAARQSTKVVFF